MSDLIDRQQAIDVIDKIFPADPMRNDYTQGITCGAALAAEYIKQLPSVQPEVIRCKDCIYQVESWIGMKYCEVNGDHIGVDYDYCSNARRKENG